jgi:23S rRNA pseudouridine1911/1915/1917 synthase
VALPDLSRRKARETIMAGLVKLDGRLVLEPKTELGDKAKLEVDLRHGLKRALQARIHDTAAPAGKPFNILYDDADLLIVDKTAGILSAPTRSKGIGEAKERGHLPELIRRAFRKQGRELNFLGVVHRLDKDTSGCICFALTKDAQRILSAQFAGQAAGRTYRAIVMGQPRNDRDTLRNKLGRGEDGRRAVVEEDEEGKDSVTNFTVLRRFAQGSELEVTLETGRTHQIRVTLADIACPVYGDRIYAFKPRKNQPLPPKAPRLMLHATELSLDHPVSGKRIIAKAPLPVEFAEFCKQIDVPLVAKPTPWSPTARPLDLNTAPALDAPTRPRAESRRRSDDESTPVRRAPRRPRDA